MSRDPQHQPSDRVGRSPAVVEHVGPGRVARRRHILPERAEQILEQRRRADGTRESCALERDEHRIAGSVCTECWPTVGCDVRWSSRRAPVVEQPQALVRRRCRARRRSRRRCGRTRRSRRCAAASPPAAGATRRESSRSARARAARSGRRRAPAPDRALTTRARARRRGGSRPAPSRTAGRTAGSRRSRTPARRASRPRPTIAALGAAADGARDVERRARRRAAGQDEPAQRRQLRLRARSIHSSRRWRRRPVDRGLRRRGRRLCCAGSASRAPIANRSRWICSSIARKLPHRRTPARTQPSQALSSSTSP